MNHTPTVLALVALVATLSILGAVTGNAAVITMAASSLTGLFAFLQVRKEGQ